jgi:hypothetical protein
MRAVIIRLTGPDGHAGTCTFRPDTHPALFAGRTDEQVVAQAAMSAITSGLEQYGQGWFTSHTVHVVA